MPQWSTQIEQAYRLTLPGDIRAWLDDELWRSHLGAEFCSPLEPAQLLSPGREEIWAGFMPPDALPLIGNDYGDWLCLRVGRDGQVVEIIRWRHSGGDWLPMGRTLAEALLFDAAIRVLRDRRPEFTEPEPPRERVFGAAQWARSQLAPSLEPFWDDHQADDAEALLRALIDAGVAEAAACQELTLRQLGSELKRRGGPQTARKLNVPWQPDFVRWLFDGSSMSESARSQVAALWHVDPQSLVAQDWDAAETTALRVVDRRCDLPWAFDVAGWAAERREDWDQARQMYLRGLAASVFADDAIRFRTQWFPEGFGKFAAYRLRQLHDDGRLPGDAVAEGGPYLQLLWQNDADTLRDRVSDFWQQQARRQLRQDRPWEACQCLLRCGWDLGLSDLSAYRGLLKQLVDAARAAGAEAPARVAETHLRVF